MPKTKPLFRTRVINGKRYRGLRSYPSRTDAQREANRWIGEPLMSAKVTVEPDGQYIVWVRMKKVGGR